MQGIYWNGDAIANKGMTSSHSHGMFSVGSLVAFETSGYCSPDGSHYTSGCNLVSAPYFLQDEITLEEFDKTHVDKYGSGSYDKQEIINLRDKFFHEWSNNWTPPYWLKFLCAILDDNTPRLSQELCPQPRIEEVRNNQGKFLHIYTVDRPIYEIAEKSLFFEDAIEKISNLFNVSKNCINALEKIAAEKRLRLGVKFTEEGIEAKALEAEKKSEKDAKEIRRLREYIGDLNNNHAIAMLWQAPYYSRPDNNQIKDDESVKAPYRGEYAGDRVGTVRAEELLIYRIVKKIKAPIGIYCGSFRASGVVDIFETDGEITYRLNRYESWCNSQEWHEQPVYDIVRFEIESGEEGSMKEYNDEAKKRINERKQNFETFSKIVTENFGNDILKLAMKKKGKIIKTLDVLSRFIWIEKSKVSKALWESSSPEVLENILLLVDRNIPKRRMEKARDKGGAWAYINAVLPEISFKGKFDDVTKAIELYLKLFY